MKSTNQSTIRSFAKPWEQFVSLVRFSALMLMMAIAATAARAADYFPNNTADLIAAINSANANGTDDVIHLKNGQVYTLTANLGSETGLPAINSNFKLTILGNGATIERAPTAPTFRLLLSYSELTLEKLTLRGGKTTAYGGAAVHSLGKLTLLGCTFEDNVVEQTLGNWPGGAVLNSGGELAIDGCTFRRNTAANGGGLASIGDSTYPIGVVVPLTISNSAFVYNTAKLGAGNVGGNGGGIALYNAHEADIFSTTIANNKAGYEGGGIAFFTLPRHNSKGKTLHVGLRNVTIAYNQAKAGGGVSYQVCGAICQTPTAPDFANSIIAGNLATTGPNHTANYYFKSSSPSILGPGQATFAADPDNNNFAPAANIPVGLSLGELNGFSQTGDPGSEGYRPLSKLNSLVIDAADPSFCPTRDQLGSSRVGTCDMGAIEYLPCVVPPADMTAWWAFDSFFTLEDIATWSFPNHAATPNAPLQVPGMVGGAVKFTNADQVLEVPSQNDINLFNSCAVDGGATFSIDAWVKTTATGTQVILDKRQFSGSGGIKGYHLFLYQGRLGFQLADGVSYANFIAPSGTALNDGQWHFIAVTIYVRCQRNGSVFEGKLYVDGNVVHTFAPGGGDYSNNAPLRIGGHSFTSSMFFDGSLDEIEIFHRTLSATEIQALYNAGWAGKCGKKIPPGCTHPNDPNRSCF